MVDCNNLTAVLNSCANVTCDCYSNNLANFGGHWSMLWIFVGVAGILLSLLIWNILRVMGEGPL